MRLLLLTLLAFSQDHPNSPFHCITGRISLLFPSFQKCYDTLNMLFGCKNLCLIKNQFNLLAKCLMLDFPIYKLLSHLQCLFVGLFHCITPKDSRRLDMMNEKIKQERVKATTDDFAIDYRKPSESKMNQKLYQRLMDTNTRDKVRYVVRNIDKVPDIDQKIASEMLPYLLYLYPLIFDTIFGSFYSLMVFCNR